MKVILIVTDINVYKIVRTELRLGDSEVKSELWTKVKNQNRTGEGKAKKGVTYTIHF